MKKILITLSLAAATTVAFAQGTVKFYNISSSFAVSTNTSRSTIIGGNQLGGSGGKTLATSVGLTYYYELLIAPMGSFTSGTANSTNPVASGWTASGLILGTNYLGSGGIGGPGASGGTAVSGWPSAPTTGSAYTDGTEMDYLIVGWSANLGTSWLAVSNEVQTAFFSGITNGYYGVSQMGYGYSGGGGTPALLAPSLFGVSSGEPGGIAGGFVLYQVPEPSTIALATLGGLSLLFIRRRK